jgi:hypothetical protein
MSAGLLRRASGVRGAGNGTQTEALVPGGVNSGDWLRIRLTMDLSANGGAGFGDVSFKNLTQGDSSFTAVTGLQGVDLQMGGIDATLWNSLHIRSDLSQPNSRIDNLTVQVPEPNGWLLCVVGGVLLLIVLRQRQRD